MNTHEEFEDFLRLLNENKVEYVIVGGYAVAFHGYVRVTLLSTRKLPDGHRTLLI